MFYRIKSSSSHYWCTWVEWFSSLRTVSSLESIISLILRRSNQFLTGIVMPPDSFSQSVGFCGSRWPFNGSLLWCQRSRSALALPIKPGSISPNVKISLEQREVARMIWQCVVHNPTTSAFGTWGLDYRNKVPDTNTSPFVIFFIGFPCKYPIDPY